MNDQIARVKHLIDECDLHINEADESMKHALNKDMYNDACASLQYWSGKRIAYKEALWLLAKVNYKN